MEIPVEDMLRDTVDLATDARRRNIELRVMGGLGVYLHCMEHRSEISQLYRSLNRVGLGRSLLGDVDLIAYSSQRKDIVNFFEKEKNLMPDIRFNFMFGFKRMIYQKANSYEIDLFFDKLQYSHDLVFGGKRGEGRLELDFPTITLTDLVLSKLQIHKITRKDLVDLILLFLFHDLGDSDSSEVINSTRIGETLAEDWGFWYDAISNLKETMRIACEIGSERKMTTEQSGIVRSRIEKLINVTESTPKSGSWEKRAKAGTSKPWFRDVEEVVRG